MISLDQVLLLEQKVESAVAKIAQLQAENDALRSKCAELTNALSTKSEQLTTIESDQNRIESGILKALDRLNSIENSVLKAVAPTEKEAEPTQQLSTAIPQDNTYAEQSSHEEQVQQQQQQSEQKSFFDMSSVGNTQSQNQQQQNFINTQAQNPSPYEQKDSSSEESGQFDIF